MNVKKIVCKDTGETTKVYKDYLRTKHWRLLREKIAKLYDYSCADCGKSIVEGYEIHHLTYKRIGNEKIDDLVCLCKDCHEKRTKDIKEKKERNKKLSNAKLSDKIKYTEEMKKKVNLVLNSRKSVKRLFNKHFDRFLIDLKKLEEKEGK